MSKKLNLLILTGVVAATSAGIATSLTSSSIAKSQLATVATTTGEASSGVSTLLDETVYVFTDSAGKVRRIISSDWTKTALDTDQYTKVEDNSKKTPIEVKITYTLDGKKVPASELTGKSGKVTITYEYANTEKVGDYYVPYAVMTGMMLDNDTFKNVEVEGGRLMNDGSRTVVAGVALPGMQENLNISENDFNIPKSLKITADATNFKLGMSMSLATTSIFQDLDTAKLDSIDELQGQLAKLTDGMNQLMTGSSQLYDGLAELNDKSGTLTSAINQLTAGSVELKNGLTAAANGGGALQAGVGTLAGGLDQLTANNDSLNNTAEQTFTSLLKGTHDTIQYQTYTTVLQTALQKYAQASEAYGSVVVDMTAINAAMQENTIPEFTVDNYQAVLDGLIAKASAGGDETTAQTLKQAKAGLVSYQTLYLPGLAEYTGTISVMGDSVNGELLPGLASLNAGLSELAAGAGTLSGGLTELNNSTPSLISGITQLKNGSGQLKDGITQLNTEGIQKLVSAYGGVQNLSMRLKDSVDLAKRNGGKAKYIYRTDEIK